MKLRRHPVFNVTFAKGDSWAQSAWLGIKLALLFAPTTFVSAVLMPALSWILSMVLGLIMLVWYLVSWFGCLVLVLAAGLCGRLRAISTDSSQR